MHLRGISQIKYMSIPMSILYLILRSISIHQLKKMFLVVMLIISNSRQCMSPKFWHSLKGGPKTPRPRTWDPRTLDLETGIQQFKTWDPGL